MTELKTHNAVEIDVCQWTKAWAQGHGLKVWQSYETSSTNTIAKEDSSDQTKPVLMVNDASAPNSGSFGKHASAQISEASVYLAARQTQGRGRGDHRWETPPGSALLSSWSFALSGAPQPVLSPQVGLALFDAAMATWPNLDFNLKAPNDLFIDRLKVAGLLIETVDWGHERRTVVGLGLNVVSSPPDLATSTSLCAALRNASMGSSSESLHGAHARESLNEAQARESSNEAQAREAPFGTAVFSQERWALFLSAFYVNLKTAMLEGMNSKMTPSVTARLRLALNLHPLLKEPIDRVDELGQLHSATRTIHWHEL